MKTNVIIYGAGQNGRIILDILKSHNKYRVVGFIDDDRKLLHQKINDIPILGDSSYLEQLITNDHINNAFVSIGDNTIRANKADKLKSIGFILINAIHEKTIISENVKIGTNVQVTAGAIINTGCKIGNNVIINTGAIIDHDNEIENNVQIGPGVKLAGAVKIGEYTFVGTGAVIINKVTVGKNVIIGAGTIVLKNIPDNVLVVGIPGRICKHR